MENFGDPWHTKNLPPFDLVEGETYLVPLKLLSKERRFDGGRGTEYYEFNYHMDNYGYKSFRIPDYHMTSEIQEFHDKDEEDYDISKRSTFC